MTSFALKIIACLTMFIDHFTYLFVPYNLATELGGRTIAWHLVGRGIGRIAFPIYCFLLVEGFYHTSNRKKYMLRMLIFALISEIPFDLAFSGFPAPASCILHQNVMFTLLLGLVLMYLYEELKARYLMQPLIFNTLGVILIVGVSAVALFLKTDYRYLGILIILIFYLFRGKKIWIAVVLAAVLYFFSDPLEGLALIALLPIFCYNGKQGRKVKYLFYAFYPVHLLLLGLAARLL
ncbi:MAG: conjugal transfer protein TraX [Lachnospiraceae bacterium]|nr:conjugal transfer protein TraX [Lachnospiraceae bacterium]